MGWITRATALSAAAALLALGGPVAGASADSPAPRVDLNVLVVDDGGPAVAAITSELASEGTPYTKVDLTSSTRPTIDAAFLSDTVDGVPRAKFQAVVLPDDNPFGADPAEMDAIASYEKDFGIRQVDAYNYADPDVGLNYPQSGGYIGSLDGDTGQVTTEGEAGPFGYLKGSVPFEDNSPTVTESYGYLSTPLTAMAAGDSFTPLVDMAIPGADARGSLVGEYDHDGRSELVVTFAYNQYQEQYRLLARGMVEWMTQGVHLGTDRNYFSVNVDDVFLADDRWNTTLKCTPGDVDCPVGTDGNDPDPIRMSVADAQYAQQWEEQNGLTFDLVFNGGGSDDYKSDNGGTDPMAQQLISEKDSFRWVNHTYDHEFLGCVQNVTVVPWTCTTDASGATEWTPQSTIESEITQNEAWAGANGLPLNPAELVTGEHSGLEIQPQQPQDNPNLAPALARTGIQWVASDSSREPAQRSVGSALTVPRTPMNVYYNAGHANEETDEYNWIYTSKAQGGSGLCDSAGNSTCLSAPLDDTTGYTSYIVPTEAKIDLGHILNNDPDPFFIHQSNLSEDRIAYPALDAILNAYHSLFADNTPFVNQRMADIGTELKQQADWNTAVSNGSVTAYRIGDTVTVDAPSGVQVPLTVPTGSRQVQGDGTTTAFGGAYAGTLTGWAAPATAQTAVTVNLPGSATPAALAHHRTTAAARVPALTVRPAVPGGVRKAVPIGPGDIRE
ncbi:hypothetical protein ABZ832_11480 [Streptantibioticus parmotrematis]|uniref:hypothetical protein n=1 Tax=Streptantibioticus parmotrematis TaxID=2873249 RepID=UPI0033C7B05B